MTDLTTPVIPQFNYDWFNGVSLGYDYEFDADTTSLPSGWSWTNQGSATYIEKFGRGSLMAPASASLNARVIDRAIPAESSWTAYAHVRSIKKQANYATTGLILRDSSSGKLVNFYVNASWPPIIGVDRLTNVSTYASTIGGGYAAVGSPGDLYMRIRRNSGTSWDFAFSPDGVSWIDYATAQDLTTHLTVNRIGFFADTSNSSPAVCSLSWFRIRA